MAVTMKDIAQAAGVSTATVSKIINGADQHISEGTRRRIYALIREMGYVPNAVAKGLKVKRTHMLGFILPDISNPFFPEIARGIEDMAQQHGFGVVLCNTDDDAGKERDAVRFLSSRMVDGIIFIRSLRRGDLKPYALFGIPIVMVDREVDSSEMDFGQVYVDTQQATYEAARAMLSKGCRTLAFISAEMATPYDRYQGYRRALEEAGMPVREALVYRDRYNVETGRVGMLRILERESPDGVVCGNDLIALGALGVLHEKGLRVPEDVRVMGFDDIYFSRHLSPPLSTVHQPAYQMGAAAAGMLIKNILHQQPLGRLRLDFEVLMRGTV